MNKTKLILNLRRYERSLTEALGEVAPQNRRPIYTPLFKVNCLLAKLYGKQQALHQARDYARKALDCYNYILFEEREEGGKLANYFRGVKKTFGLDGPNKTWLDCHQERIFPEGGNTSSFTRSLDDVGKTPEQQSYLANILGELGSQ